MTLLRMQQVTRHFGRRAVLQDIDLEVAAGDRIALEGANGSGKTTLLRIAAGTLRPTGGRVEADRHRTAFLAQDAPVYRELSVADHLRFLAKVHNRPWDPQDAIHHLQDAGLARQADRPAGTLSRGQRQRLAITLAFAADADLLLLDEPWTALDTQGSRWLEQRLDRTGPAVLAAVHQGTPFQPDRLLHLQGGRLQ